MPSLHTLTLIRSKKRSAKLSLPNPLQTLAILTDKESSLILLYNGLFFTGMMVVTASIPTLYESIYHLNTLYTGLCYISMGMGSLASTLTMGHVVDWNFRRHARNLGLQISKTRQQDLSNFPIERVRFEVVVPGHVIGTIGILIFGWTLKFRTSLAGPEVALFLIGFGVSTAFNITNTLLIDLHRDQPATATAAVNFVRCLMSAGGAAAIIPMCNAMGIGWAFTFLALVYVILILAVFWLMRCGMRWRNEAKAKKEEVAAVAKKRETEEEAGREGEVDAESKDEEEEISDRKKT